MGRNQTKRESQEIIGHSMMVAWIQRKSLLLKPTVVVLQQDHSVLNENYSLNCSNGECRIEERRRRGRSSANKNWVTNINVYVNVIALTYKESIRNQDF